MPAPPLTHTTAVAAVDAAIKRWRDTRLARIPGFTRANFGVRGAWRLNRIGLGWDLARTPANLALTLPNLGRIMAASGLRYAGRAAWLPGAAHLSRAGGRLETTRLFFDTDVARETAWRVRVELLGLPTQMVGPGGAIRTSTTDALATAVLADPHIAHSLSSIIAELQQQANDPHHRQRLETALLAYTDTRTAAAEIAGGLLTTSVGAASLHQLTPGALTLGPAVAGVLAHHIAVAGFPLGASLGGLWYAAFPIAAPGWLVAATTGGVAISVAGVAALAGVVTDPVQAALGLHQRRLRRLVDVVAAQLRGESAATLSPRDHYAARILDLIDVLGAVSRQLRQ